MNDSYIDASVNSPQIDLICPKCRKNITRQDNGYICDNCKEVYPIYNGIPCFKAISEEIDSYDEGYFEIFYETENRHFWQIGRREIIYSLLKRIYPNDLSKMNMFEMGCGNGVLIHFLKSKGINIAGGDIFLNGLQYCKKRANVKLYQLDALNTPFVDNQYDIIGIFDVIEHINDDLSILKEAYRICKHGGRIILTVPASKLLWSYFDIFLHHKRRYSKNELYDRLQEAGFKVEWGSYYGFFLFPLLFLYRKFMNTFYSHNKLSDESEIKIIPIINNIFLALMRLENLIMKHKRFPFGIWLIAIAKK